MRWFQLGLLDDGRHDDAAVVRHRQRRRHVDEPVQQGPVVRRARRSTRPKRRSRSSRTRSTRRPCGPTARAITCDDFEFTWDSIAHGKDIYDPTGYTDIDSVDCPDATTVKVNFSEPYSGWKQLFGGHYGLLPTHILEGKTAPTRCRTATSGRAVRGSSITGPRASSRARPEHEVLGHQAQARQGRRSRSRPTRPRSSSPSRTTKSRRSTRSRSSTWSTSSSPAYRTRSRRSTRTPATSRRCGSTTQPLRSTTSQCVKRWATPSTATRS